MFTTLVWPTSNWNSRSVGHEMLLKMLLICTKNCETEFAMNYYYFCRMRSSLPSVNSMEADQSFKDFFGKQIF